MKLFLIFLIGVLFSSHAAQANEGFIATVVAVMDGNTMDIQSEKNGRQRVLLAGIDCPELDQEFGKQAKAYLEKLVLGKKVVVQLQGKDAFGKHFAIVTVDDDDLRVELLKEGLAWTVEKNPVKELQPYRTWAQQKGRGLWKQSNPTPPWVFRRQQSMMQPKSS